MIEIKQLRLVLAQSRVAQPHSSSVGGSFPTGVFSERPRLTIGPRNWTSDDRGKLSALEADDPQCQFRVALRQSVAGELASVPDRPEADARHPPSVLFGSLGHRPDGPPNERRRSG